jgi:hypothetical protein
MPAPSRWRRRQPGNLVRRLSPAAPVGNRRLSPAAPVGNLGGWHSPASPVHNPASPVHNPASPVHNPASPVHNPASPVHNPANPVACRSPRDGSLLAARAPRPQRLSSLPATYRSRHKELRSLPLRRSTTVVVSTTVQATARKIRRHTSTTTRVFSA